MIGGLGSGKTNILLNLIKIKDDDDYIIDKIYLYVKNLNEAICQCHVKNVKKWP